MSSVQKRVFISSLSAFIPIIQQTSSPWFSVRVSNRPPQSISSSDSGSLSLGFKSPISIGGVLFNLERTTLHRKRHKHQSHTSHFIMVIIDLKKSEDIRESSAAERDAIEQLLTSRRRNKARPRWARRRRGATSSTWWWTSCCCDRWGPTQAREEGKAQNQSEETEGGVKKKKGTSERSY